MTLTCGSLPWNLTATLALRPCSIASPSFWLKPTTSSSGTVSSESAQEAMASTKQSMQSLPVGDPA